MSIPTDKQCRLPILKMMGDNKERHRKDIFDSLDKVFQFSEEDKTQRLATGGYRLGSRMIWALASLKAAGLLENPRRGYYRITEQGQNALKENPSVINTKFLLRYAPSDSPFYYPQKKNKGMTDNAQDADEEQDSSQTPLELIEQNYQLLKDNLSNELLEYIKNKPPEFFENLVVDLLLAMGYGGSRKEAGEAIGKSHDGGIDGIIKEDKLGLDIIYLQAKRYDSGSIGEGSIRNFVGALAAKHAQKGIFITTAGYSNSAREYVKKVPQKVILIGGDDLVDFMIENNVGVSKDYTFEIKKIDLDYFEE